MGHLFYNELGGKAKSPISLSSDPDLALFTHVQYGYWSGTGFAPDPRLAWFFLFDYYERTGKQSADFKINSGYKNGYIFYEIKRHLGFLITKCLFLLVENVGKTLNQLFSILQDWNEILKDIPMDNYPQP
ncbi:hypothetical protein [Nitrosomonas sp.]|uniref:hypothetical protein n=1 Tax=Nitrosomonas sp. TaxID=42353 RepID=UPI001D8804CC|nr:hypothetical protein [Nitrosomonas sp.]MBX3618287.1 hypothetical protein [Nitrosomonas sp.]